MKKQLAVKKEISLRTDKNYIAFLNDIKKRLHAAQTRAVLASNVEQIKFYWHVGMSMIEKQKAFAWGEQFIEQFSHDMRQTYPEMQGFSVTNLKRMRIFARIYPNFLKSPQAVDELPWGHIAILLHQVKDAAERSWYVNEALKNGWSRPTLEIQIESELYSRQGKVSKKATNFHEHLPQEQSNIANEALKDPYHFDFLTIHGKAHERVVENGLVTHIKDFLIELGQGFAFVGSQVPLTFEDQEFFVDLLFYHLNLRCFVVIELKATKLKPEHTGQLGFYLAAVDNLLRKEGDNRTIGILLCKSKSKVVAEYALQNIQAPIGISEYRLSKALPKELKTSLPTVEEIEAELNEVAKNKKNKRKKKAKKK